MRFNFQTNWLSNLDRDPLPKPIYRKKEITDKRIGLIKPVQRNGVLFLFWSLKITYFENCTKKRV